VKLHELVMIGEVIGLDAEWLYQDDGEPKFDVAFVTAVEGDVDWETHQLNKLMALIPEDLFGFKLSTSEQTGRRVLFAVARTVDQLVLPKTRTHILQWALSDYHANCMDDLDDSVEGGDAVEYLRAVEGVCKEFGLSFTEEPVKETGLEKGGTV
jgi:hypothetical protein